MRVWKPSARAAPARVWTHLAEGSWALVAQALDAGIPLQTPHPSGTGFLWGAVIASGPRRTTPEWLAWEAAAAALWRRARAAAAITDADVLAKAAWVGCPDKVALFLGWGAPLDPSGARPGALCAWSARYWHGAADRTALLGKAEVGWEPTTPERLRCLDLLLQAQGCPDRFSWGGAFPLLLALLAKDLPATQALLRAGTNPNQQGLGQGWYAMRPLEIALLSGSEACFSWLLSAGANPFEPASLRASESPSACIVDLCAGLGRRGMAECLVQQAQQGSRCRGLLEANLDLAFALENQEMMAWFLEKSPLLRTSEGLVGRLEQLVAGGKVDTAYWLWEQAKAQLHSGIRPALDATSAQRIHALLPGVAGEVRILPAK